MGPTTRAQGSRVREWWREFGSGTHRQGRRVLALTILGVAAGIGESAVVILVIALASSHSGRDLPLVGDHVTATPALAGLALASVLVLAVAHLAAARAGARFSAQAERDLQRRLMAAYLHAPWEAQSAMPTGELQDLVATRAGEVAFGTQQAASALATAVNLAVVIVVALLVSVWATVFLLVALGFVLLLALSQRGRGRSAMEAIIEASTGVGIEVTETGLTARELRIFGVVEPALARVEAKIDAASRLSEAWLQRALAVPLLTRDASIALLIVGLALIVGTTDVSLSTLGVAVILVLRALGHAQALASVAQNLVERTASHNRIKERLAAWRPTAPRGNRPCPRIDHVSLREVGHVYRPGAAPALDGVDLDVRRGEMLGIVGRTGAGKSTLASVILGITDPTRGEVVADGVPLREFEEGAWHRRTAWVAQEPRLLTGTVAENVRFLRPWIGDDRVAEAVRIAGLGPEVAGWAAGLDHDVGPAGATLSGGERQRVALARAIAGEPDLIVLDEPTSALDAHSEAAVREALEAIRPRAAVVVIAHRLSTVRTCDRVAVMEAGRLVASAPPRELEATNRWFREALELSGA
jgi:ABC-type multidrug transport system fused ATPase/permease subunit